MQDFSTIVSRVIALVLIYSSTAINCAKMRREETSLCHPFPGIIFDQNKIKYLQNGSLEYNELVYPTGTYYVSGEDTYGCVCDLRGCLKKCCKRNEILGESDRPKCTRLSNGLPAKDLALKSSELAAEIRGISGVSELFVLVEDMQCPDNASVRYMLEPEQYEEDAFVLAANGSLHTRKKHFPPWSYCLDWKESFEKVGVLVCELANNRNGEKKTEKEGEHEYFSFGIMVSIPFFVATFLVYAIIPELRNLYGKTLMCYVGCLVLAYTFLVLAKLLYLPHAFCYTIAFIMYFSFLASFFWLNVMCFDIWWTFGGFRSLQGSVKQRERKKFLIYSIYAWGCASLLTAVCITMEFFPDIPDYFIKPKFGYQSCWFDTDKAKAIYFYGPMGITVFCNICLFISTALKIVQHKKDTAHHLKGVNSRRHDDNKQWFNLYLKLFIVMGINWSMELISWLCNNTPSYIWYLTDLTNTLQGLIIFLIFVCKSKIKRLLLKKFNCHGSNVLSRNSTRSTYHSTTPSRTCMTSITPLQEKIIPHSNKPDDVTIDN